MYVDRQRFIRLFLLKIIDKKYFDMSLVDKANLLPFAA
jgi:hypothetical protein